ncbi:MAG: hemolysin III family protein [Lachnospiraceae bacterium]|nr:hemolysin III family protein [Lachnospiraceae bacterium]
MTDHLTDKFTSLREPGSAITHLIAAVLTAVAACPLLLKALKEDRVTFYSMLVFIVSMLMLYTASTVFHAVNSDEKTISVFRKIDHSCVFVLIAGTYTPLSLLVLPPESGRPLLTAVWSVALCGIFLKLFWVNSPKWLTATIYIIFGWFVLGVYDVLLVLLSRPALWLFFGGGVIYTLGGILYSLRTDAFDTKHPLFDAHAVFHLFVMAGSLCHFIFMFRYVL